MSLKRSLSAVEKDLNTWGEVAVVAGCGQAEEGLQQQVTLTKVSTGHCLQESQPGCLQMSGVKT